jgi:hypothetical protein
MEVNADDNGKLCNETLMLRRLYSSIWEEKLYGIYPALLPFVCQTEVLRCHSVSLGASGQGGLLRGSIRLGVGLTPSAERAGSARKGAVAESATQRVSKDVPLLGPLLSSAR